MIIAIVIAIIPFTLILLTVSARGSETFFYIYIRKKTHSSYYHFGRNRCARRLWPYCLVNPLRSFVQYGRCSKTGTPLANVKMPDTMSGPENVKNTKPSIRTAAQLCANLGMWLGNSSGTEPESGNIVAYV